MEITERLDLLERRVSRLEFSERQTGLENRIVLRYVRAIANHLSLRVEVSDLERQLVEYGVSSETPTQPEVEKQ